MCAGLSQNGRRPRAPRGRSTLSSCCTMTWSRLEDVLQPHRQHGAVRHVRCQRITAVANSWRVEDRSNACWTAPSDRAGGLGRTGANSSSSLSTWLGARGRRPDLHGPQRPTTAAAEARAGLDRRKLSAVRKLARASAAGEPRRSGSVAAPWRGRPAATAPSSSWAHSAGLPRRIGLLYSQGIDFEQQSARPAARRQGAHRPAR